MTVISVEIFTSKWKRWNRAHFNIPDPKCSILMYSCLVNFQRKNAIALKRQQNIHLLLLEISMKTFFHSISFAIHLVNCRNTTYGQTTSRNIVNFSADKLEINSTWNMKHILINESSQWMNWRMNDMTNNWMPNAKNRLKAKTKITTQSYSAVNSHRHRK